MIYIGIDVAKDKHDCFITNSDSEVLFKAFTIFNNLDGFNDLYQKIESVMDDVTKVKVGLEATGHYSYNLLGYLIDKGLPTYVINPLHTNLYRKSLSLRETYSIPEKLVKFFNVTKTTDNTMNFLKNVDGLYDFYTESDKSLGGSINALKNATGIGKNSKVFSIFDKYGTKTVKTIEDVVFKNSKVVSNSNSESTILCMEFLNKGRGAAYCIIPDLECIAKRMDLSEFTIHRYEAVQDPIAMVSEAFVMVMSYDKDEKDFFRMTPTIKFEDASGRKYKQTFCIDIGDRLGNGVIINYAQPELCEE